MTHERVRRTQEERALQALRMELAGLESATSCARFGCGEGELAAHVPDGTWVGVDASAEMLARAPEPHQLADANALPFLDESFGSIALLYVLYHLPYPTVALCRGPARVLQPVGLVAVAAPSRHDSPELAHALPQAKLTFDAELAPELLAQIFAEVELERWDAPLLELPTKPAVRDYLTGKGVEQAVAESAPETVAVPLSVTQRGAVACARKH